MVSALFGKEGMREICCGLLHRFRQPVKSLLISLFERKGIAECFFLPLFTVVVARAPQANEAISTIQSNYPVSDI
jgi:hypothetical protein